MFLYKCSHCVIICNSRKYYVHPGWSKWRVIKMFNAFISCTGLYMSIIFQFSEKYFLTLNILIIHFWEQRPTGHKTDCRILCGVLKLYICINWEKTYHNNNVSLYTDLAKDKADISREIRKTKRANWDKKHVMGWIMPPQ